MTLETIEAECAANATAPRVSLDDIKAAIHSVRYATGDMAANVMTIRPSSPEMSLTVLTLCFVTMENGFVVIGKSAPASLDNFNPNIGQKLAYEDAVRQIWPLMGFALKERMRHVG